jgi:trimethylamine--corrinoid protein Co-methyltransferase
LFRNFSKHIQVVPSNEEQAAWLLEVLQVIFGDRQAIRQTHPVSLLLCPQSPLIIEGPHTDAYLALAGWEIPAAIMPMPLRGATAPGSLLSTLVVGNCEVLAMLCLIQAAAPGTPIIYAPCLATIDPRSGRYSGGAIEGGLGGIATTEMARYYGLPAESSGIGTDHYVPGVQAAYERALNGLLTTLSWPDILVGPGLLGGSMVLSLEQLLVDAEIFRISRRARQGLAAEESHWLEDVIHSVGPGGNFLAERSTVAQIRAGGWYMSDLGVHKPFEGWVADGCPRLLPTVRQEVDEILVSHEPLSLSQEVDAELARILNHAQSA